MFEAESVRMIVLVPAYATSAASFETSGFSVFAICSASMYRSGIRRVTKRSESGVLRPLRRVSMLVSLASRIGITLSTPPGASTVVKPFTCSTDSKTVKACATGIGDGEMIVTRPRTRSS